MAGRLRLNDCLWPALAMALGVASFMAWWVMGLAGAERWGWQAAPHPDAGSVWRWWTAALVHINAAHLQANLWATVVVAAWGWAARAGTPQGMAWLLAWPLAHALLITDPGTLSRYVGLSATLHAGAAIICWYLLWHAHGARRAVGAAVSVAILIKLGLEMPVDAQALPDAPGHVIAGHAHGCGVLAGLASAAVVDGIMRAWQRRVPTPEPP